jgi:hypothetical protein
MHTHLWLSALAGQPDVLSVLPNQHPLPTDLSLHFAPHLLMDPPILIPRRQDYTIGARVHLDTGTQDLAEIEVDVQSRTWTWSDSVILDRRGKVDMLPVHL